MNKTETFLTLRLWIGWKVLTIKVNNKVVLVFKHQKICIKGQN